MTIIFLASGFTYQLRNSKNLGDEAQQQATIERIRERFPSARILAVANSINDLPLVADVDMTYALIRYLIGANEGRGKTKRLMMAARAAHLLWNAHRVAKGGRPLLLNPHGVEALEIIRAADAAVVSGAGAFNDTFGASVAAVWALVLRLAHASGTPAYVSGQQIGPFKRWLPKMIAGWGLRHAQVIGVRDPISAETAIRIGLPSSRVILTGDDAWLLKPCSSSIARGILARFGIEGDFVGAQVRFDKATQLTETDSAALAIAINRVSELYDAPVLFMRTHYASDHDDLDAARAVQRHIIRPSALLLEELSPSQTKGGIALARAGIGVSYHFCVFSTSADIDTIGLYKSHYLRQKMSGLSAISPGNMLGVGLTELALLPDQAGKLEVFAGRPKAQVSGAGQSADGRICFQSGAAIDMLGQLGQSIDAASR